MKNLKSIRKNAHLTQKEIAEKLKIPVTTYAYYEQNENAQPPIEMLITFADFFGCSVDYLIGHQTKSLLHTDSCTPKQLQLFELIKKLNDDQATYLIGYLSHMTGSTLDALSTDQTTSDSSSSTSNPFFMP